MKKMDLWKGSEKFPQQWQHRKGERLGSMLLCVPRLRVIHQMQSAVDVAGWTRQLTVTNSLKIDCNYCDIWRKKESFEMFKIKSMVADPSREELGRL